jgi:16S rRNA (cytosine1402-N4)-methyltransferase
MTADVYHTPVMLQEALEGLRIRKDGVYVDLTFGGGGHSKAILENLDEAGKLFAFDQDEDAQINAIHDERFVLIDQNFRFMKNFLRIHRGLPVDGILADLGVSSHQFDAVNRGFSIRGEADLDMRMNKASKLSAKTIVNQYSEEQLIAILRKYGELKNAKAIAASIVSNRTEEGLKTTQDLKKSVERFAPRFKENKFYAQLFQALRLEVNDEMKALEEMLLQTADCLKSGGRLVVISYHSLEDRLVKHYIRSGNFDDIQEKDVFGVIQRPFDPLKMKALVPSEKEIEMNPRARSAKMRIAIKR